MKSITSTFTFTEKASPPKNGIALIYDLEGFSRFFNQPDVQTYVPVFLNHVSAAISQTFFGGKPYWTPDTQSLSPMKLRVVHEKFMGDGGLYVLMPPDKKEEFSTGQLAILCNRLWNIKSFFNRVVDTALEKVPVAELPRKIRFGLSRGTIYELRSASHNRREYIGFCINLASRLQSYCRDLGFIASARLMMSDELLSKYGYKKVIATKLRGFPSEVVIVDAQEYNSLEENLRKELFDELPTYR